MSFFLMPHTKVITEDTSFKPIKDLSNKKEECENMIAVLSFKLAVGY